MLLRDKIKKEKMTVGISEIWALTKAKLNEENLCSSPEVNS